MAARRLAALHGHVAGATGPEPTTANTPLRPAQTGAHGGHELRAAYDFIVVGAGSAGCVVASRLSEDPNVSVLLIEAGPSNQSFLVRSPFITCPFLQNSERDWAFRTSPQQRARNRISFWPRGKTLGGSSSINYMLYVRGDRRNYDQWASDFGCTGWSYEDVLPYFKKSEKYLGSCDGQSSHGKDGPLSVTHLKDKNFHTKEISEMFVSSCENAGLAGNPDLNGSSQEGAALSQVTIENGVRCDVASAYLFNNGAINRKNLHVLTGHTATRLISQGRRVIGVCLRSCGTVSTEPDILVQASKEVVVSAGAVGTPWLMMLSGIGPASHLKEHDIEVVADLPVGQNLQDHLFLPMTFACKVGHESKAFCDKNPIHIGRLLAEYALGTGLGCCPWVTAMAFCRSGRRHERDGNDLQIHFVPLISHNATLAEKNMGFTPDEIDVNGPRYGITMLASLILPRSVGYIRLRSTDPLEYPEIQPNYLTEEDDVQALVDIAKFCRKIAKTPPLADVLGEEHKHKHIEHELDSDDYIREGIERSVITIYHPVGTAKMGPAGDKQAVVSPDLKVHGLVGLRVADASIMPRIVSGNTNAPAIMIGERAADMIRSDWALTSA